MAFQKHHFQRCLRSFSRFFPECFSGKSTPKNSKKFLKVISSKPLTKLLKAFISFGSLLGNVCVKQSYVMDSFPGLVFVHCWSPFGTNFGVISGLGFGYILEPLDPMDFADFGALIGENKERFLVLIIPKCNGT